MRVGVRGAGGVLGRAVVARLSTQPDLEAVDVGEDEAVDVVVQAVPPAGWASVTGVPGIAAALRQVDAARGRVDVAGAGWWGGLGTLLAAVAVDEATKDGATGVHDVHVAYGLPGSRGAFGRASSTLRRELVLVATDAATARVDGERVSEPLGEGRRLAWFPAPVGPAHAVAVGGLEHLAPLAAPTVRTWLAAGSMTAELLQAVGRLDVDRGPGRWLHRRAAARGGGPGATRAVRWAVVVEVRDRDGGIVRAWANGTDPVAASADLLVVGARRLVGHRGPLSTGTVLDLGGPAALLDELADLRSLRWSLARPQPSPR